MKPSALIHTIAGSRWLFVLRRYGRQIGVRAAIFCVLAVGVALVAEPLGVLVPAGLAVSIGGEAVDRILTIVASSMLAVTTFSLSTMVAAYAAAASSATPRAASLLIEDRHSQTTLSTFIGAFLFSVVGIVAVSSDLYGSHGRVIIFAVTVLVIAAVVVALVRWIDQLARLGRVGETIERIEVATVAAMRTRRGVLHLGGRPLPAAPADGATVAAESVGYVQHIDMAALDALAAKREIDLVLDVQPGSFVGLASPLLRLGGHDPVQPEEAERLRGAFVIGHKRTFEQDPRFGVIVLAEVASKALSPGINDPGTAIDVLSSMVRVLTLWQSEVLEPPEDVQYERVHVPGIRLGELFDDAFAPIARDGAATLEVMVRLQKALAALAALGPEHAREAARHADLALQRARQAMTLPSDVETVVAAVDGRPGAR